MNEKLGFEHAENIERGKAGVFIFRELTCRWDECREFFTYWRLTALSSSLLPHSLNGRDELTRGLDTNQWPWRHDFART